MSFLFRLLGGKSGVAIFKARDYVESVSESDEQLRELTVGESADLDLPDELDAKFKTKGGKRFSVDGVRVKRLK